MWGGGVLELRGSVHVNTRPRTSFRTRARVDTCSTVTLEELKKIRRGRRGGGQSSAESDGRQGDGPEEDAVKEWTRRRNTESLRKARFQ